MVKEHTAKQTARKEEQGKSIFIKKFLKNKKYHEISPFKNKNERKLFNQETN